MATDITICSNALMMLGDAPIASLSEGTTRATLCANLYPIARADVLRSHPWNCLITRVLLPPRSDTPPFSTNGGRWFNKPGDWLRTLAVGQDGCQMDYEFEGGRFIAQTDSLALRYLANKSEGEWDSNLVNVMVKRMEMDLAYAITKSASLRDSLKGEFYARGGVLQRAKAVDGQENQPEEFGDSPFLAVRSGGT